jgi:hypothetical protein
VVFMAFLLGAIADLKPSCPAKARTSSIPERSK